MDRHHGGRATGRGVRRHGHAGGSTGQPAAVDMALFDAPEETAPPVSLADKFIVGPFSILDRRQGEWRTRKDKWLGLGIRSEVGRADNLAYNVDQGSEGWVALTAANATTSIFDPVLCELAYRWFSNEGDAVLDPFAGGSVRGVVASSLARRYVGIELRPEQVEANRDQAHLGSSITPRWIEGDARRAADLLDDAEFDLVFTCPPYADLEVYSDDPRDLSNMPYDMFLDGYAEALSAAARHLTRDRFFIVVISDVRDRARQLPGAAVRHGEGCAGLRAAPLQRRRDPPPREVRAAARCWDVQVPQADPPASAHVDIRQGRRESCREAAKRRRRLMSHPICTPRPVALPTPSLPPVTGQRHH